jgi:phosphopantothenoylcysteine decarboxylase/phosphopantothenate--cysteine ligase
MFSVVEDLFSHCDCFISVAAVSDWRPAEVHEQKVKKGEDRQVVGFVANPDILRTMASRKSESQVIVGFCAETENLEENARTKLESKNLDWIAGNWVGKESRGRGFGSFENQLLLLGKNGAKEILGPGLKSGLAVQLISRVLS